MDFLVKDLFFKESFKDKMSAPTWYHDFKKAFPNKIGFFKVGDFYECYAYDALRVAEICDLQLGVTGDGYVICGFQARQLELIIGKSIDFLGSIAILQEK